MSFDGTGISVFELKREIITQSKLGDGTDFELTVSSESSNEGTKPMQASHTAITNTEQLMTMILRSYQDLQPSLRDGCLPASLDEEERAVMYQARCHKMQDPLTGKKPQPDNRY